MKNFILILVGSISTAFGIKGFLISSHFIDGGVTGISMLVNELSSIPISVLVSLINIPFIILGYQQLGKLFALKSVVAILTLSLLLAFVPFPDVTPDKLLTAIFGGFFIGVGIGLAIRGGAVLDGTEIAALLINRHRPMLKVADVILMMNLVIFTSAVFILGVEPALYSIITYFAAARMIDFVVNGIEEYIGVTIVSPKYAEIRQMVTEKLGRAVTIYQGKNGYPAGGIESRNIEIIYSVMTRLEVDQLQREVHLIDANAFIIYQSIQEIKGGIVKRRPLGH